MLTRFKFLATAVAFALMTGCASVPMESKEADAALKTFAAPPADKVGLYVYRDNFAGKALKRNVLVDGKVIGQTANRVYFYKLLQPGTHRLGTESEFSDNEIDLTTIAGQNYYVRQSIKMGVFVGGAKLTVVTPEEGQKAIQKCGLAKPF